MEFFPDGKMELTYFNGDLQIGKSKTFPTVPSRYKVLLANFPNAKEDKVKGKGGNKEKDTPSIKATPGQLEPSTEQKAPIKGKLNEEEGEQ